MTNSDTNTERDTGEADDVGALIRYAGRRKPVDAARMEAARRRVGDHWQSVVADRRRRRYGGGFRVLALAASVVAAAGIAFLLWRPGTPAATGPVATVERAAGDVRLAGGPLAPGDRVPAGAEIQTLDNGFVALGLAGGQSLRLAGSSRLRIDDARHMALGFGRVYVDAGSGMDRESVFIDTPFGTATDVGTQFLVAVSPEGLTVGVREGLVALHRAGHDTLPIESGTAVDIAAGGDMHERDLPPTGPFWNWAASIAPQFDIDGATLAEYLAWYARERGLALTWQDAGSRERANAVRLSGSITNRTLDGGFEEVRRIAPFDFEIAAGALRVRVE